MKKIVSIGCLLTSASIAISGAVPVSASPYEPFQTEPEAFGSQSDTDDKFAIFAPSQTPVDHRIEYEIWDIALKNTVVSMGPSIRKKPFIQPGATESRIRIGHKSRYRNEGSMMAFSLFDKEVIASFGEYRRELEGVASSLDITTLPRNEQLAFWFNLHNVAMVEKIAENWPMRTPRKLLIDGVPLNEAKFLTVRGISMSLADIRERIVFANWKDPRVIYGFWRGEIGGPALETNAFTGRNVNSLLSVKADEFVNSLRGTQKRGKTLDVSTLYQDVARFYFSDFERDVRKHLAEFANEDVAKILARTTNVQASIYDWSIADLSGGARNLITGPNARAGPGDTVIWMLQQRARKLQYMERKDIRTGRVYFTEIPIPGQDLNAGQVE